eukprot:5244009-Amphidinium_carterae.1
MRHLTAGPNQSAMPRVAKGAEKERQEEVYPKRNCSRVKVQNHPERCPKRRKILHEARARELPGSKAARQLGTLSALKQAARAVPNNAKL